MIFRVVLAAGFLGSAALPASAQQPPVSFAMPSGNVACVYTPAGGTTVYTSPDGSAELSCDRAAPSYLRVTMTELSKPVTDKNVSDRGCCEADETLAYGATWTRGPFSCEAAKTGLTCRRQDGRGFTVSRAAIRTF